jgi:hypothetical protein
MCTPLLTIGRLRIFASREDDSALRVSTFADAKIRSLRFALGRSRLAFTMTRRAIWR